MKSININDVQTLFVMNIHQLHPANIVSFIRRCFLTLFQRNAMIRFGDGTMYETGL